MSLSLTDIIIILISVVAVIAILTAVFFVFYARRKAGHSRRFLSLPTEDAFEPGKGDFEFGRKKAPTEWKGHGRTLSSSSDTPLMLPNPHQWTPTPYRSTSGVGPHGASPYRDTSPGTRSPPSRLQELQPVSLVTITNSARPTPHSKAFITDLEPPSSDLVVSPPVLPQPLPSSTQSLKINKSRRTGSMRTALLTHLASVRHQQNKSTEDDEDVSPKSIYSQSSLAYSTRQSSRPGSVHKNEPDHRQAEKLSESTESHLRDSVVFQLPPVASPQNSNTFEDVSLTPSVTPKPSVETYSPVTLHADINTESPTEEGDWRSLRFKLLNTIQEHTIVSENGTRMYESVSRFPSLKY